MSAARPHPALIVTLALLVAAGAALRVGAAYAHQRVDFDEGRYLDNAVHLLEGDGFETSTVSFFFGDPPRPPRPEDVSSPLYPLILALVFALTGPSFVLAKGLSVAISVAAIPLVFLLGRRLFGDGPALLAAALAALQPDRAIVGAWAMTEPLYGLLVLLTLLVALPLAAGGEWSFRRSAGAGVLCGVLFLARQNGAAVAVALALILVIAPAVRGLRWRRRLGLAAAMAAAAFLICLPWFVRNTVRFGSPTFTRLKNVAWAEQARSLYTLDAANTSLATYVAAHGRQGVARNVARRVKRVTEAVLTAERGPFRWVGLLAFLAPLAAPLRRRSIFLLLPVLLSAGLLLGVAPWSGALPRYLLPLRPLLYLAGAAVVFGLGERLLATLRAGPGARKATVAAAVVAGVAWGAFSSGAVYAAYLSRDESGRNEAALAAAAWIDGHTRPDDVLLEGGLLHQYAWVFRRGVVWIPYGPLLDAMEVARRYRAGYLAATVEAVRFRPQLARYWRAEGDRLVVVGEPPGLVPVWDHRDEGIVIYRIEPAATAAQQGGGG